MKAARCILFIIILSLPLLLPTRSHADIKIVHVTPKKYVRLAFGKSSGANTINNDAQEFGYAVDDGKLSNGGSNGVALGYNVTDKFKVEVNANLMNRLSHTGDISVSPPNSQQIHQSSSTISVNSASIFVNCYYQILERKLSPYIVTGLGASSNKTKDNDITVPTGNSTYYKYAGTRVNNLAYNIGTGLNFKMSDAARLDLRYALMHLGKFSNKAPVYVQNGAAIPVARDHKESDLLAHNIMLGIELYF